MTDATEAASTTAAPEVTTETKPETTAPVEQQSTDQAPAEPKSAEQADPKPGDAAAPESGDDAADETAKKKSKGGFQKRIDELTRDKFEREAQLEQLRRENEELRKKSSPSDPGQEPKIETFTNVEDFLKAHKEWAENLGVQKGYQKAREETEQQRQEREAAQLRATISAREAATRQKYADYDVAIAPFGRALMSHPAISSYVAESETGPEVAYHLAKNPVVLDEIMRMSPYQAGRELLKLEAKLTAPPPSKPVTKAAPPITPVGARANAVKTLADLAEQDDASAYIAKMNERLKRKA